MYQEPIFFQPVFKERIWGGSSLKSKFNYEIPNEKIGECWGISAHPHGSCTILNGPLSGKTLDKVWDENRELFANEQSNEFPLLVKILDANNDLSVQVHPDDQYARKVEGEQYGKTECWYIIDCEENSEIVYGHHATTKEEFEAWIAEGRWNKLLRKVKVKPGDFFYVPSGTIHAIGKGIMILETQQSSDTTYRVYDYDRRDAEGNTRELHINKSLEVTTIPHQEPNFEPETSMNDGLLSKKLITEKYFTVYHWKLNGSFKKTLEDKYLLVSVLNGNGEIKTVGGTHPIKKGDHFIIPTTVENYELIGNAEFIVSHT
jgi:mannose-6-phosphate isomerase